VKKMDKEMDRKKNPTVAKLWVGFFISSPAQYQGLCRDLDDKIVEGLSGPRGLHFSNGVQLRFFTKDKDVVGLGHEISAHDWFQNPSAVEIDLLKELIENRRTLVQKALSELGVDREITAWFNFA
jgi:hypothetical protein